MRKTKETQDMDNRNRTQSSLVDYSQSFTTNSSKRLVNISLPDVELKGKQFYKKQPYCTICFRNYTTTFRQHHCRICSNAVCNDCSKSMINKQRACDLCVLKLTNPQEDRKKKQILETLETLCAYLIYRKKQKMQELQHLKDTDNNDTEEYMSELNKQNKIISDYEKDNEKLKKEKEQAEIQLESIRNQNQKIEEQISHICDTMIDKDLY